MSDILVEHDTVKNLAIFNNTTWNLFDLGVSFDINFDITLGILLVDGSNSFDSEVDKKISPLGREFGSNGGFDNLDKVIIVFEVNFNLYKKLEKSKNGALTPSSLVILTIVIL